MAEVKAMDTTYKVTDLKENVGLYFAVTAKNEVGFGEPCETDAVIKPKKPEGWSLGHLSRGHDDLLFMSRKF